jgi:FkbM family methyltransferase
MGMFRRLPVVRTAARHGSAVKNQLAVIEQRTAELEPGVINTLLYDSSSALEALEHLVVEMRGQDDSLANLHDHVESLHQWLEANQQTLHSSLQATVQQLAATPQVVAVQNHVTIDEFRLVVSELSRSLKWLVESEAQREQQLATVEVNPSVSPQRIETLLLQVMSRVDRMALEDQAFQERASNQWELALEQGSTLVESHRSVLDLVSTDLAEQLRSALRNDFNEDLNAGVELLSKEIGRVDDAIGAVLKTRSDAPAADWMRLEMSLRNELGGEIQRSETRVLKDLSHTKEVLSAELAARTGQIGTDLARSEMSVRDELARRTSGYNRFGDDRNDVARPSGDNGSPLLIDPALSAALHRLEATTTPLGPRLDSQQEVSVQLLSALEALKGELAGPAPKPFWDEVRSDPIEPEIALAAALAPHLRGAVAFDIGSHQGAWASALAKQGLKVIAVEANPELASALQERFADNSRVVTVASAVGDKDGVTTLMLATDTSPGKFFGDTTLFSTTRSVVPEVKEGLAFSTGPEVKTTTLSSLAKKMTKASPIALVKVDTEGTEHAVLDGLGDLRPEVLVAEFWGRGYLLNGPEPVDPELLIERMIGLGYRRWIAFVHSGDTLRARPNARSFPAEAWGNFFFFADLEPFTAALRWCDQSLANGCR